MTVKLELDIVLVTGTISQFIKMVYSYGRLMKRGRGKYSMLHRYSLGGHHSGRQVVKRTSKAVSNVVAAMRSKRLSGYGQIHSVSLEPYELPTTKGKNPVLDALAVAGNIYTAPTRYLAHGIEQGLQLIRSYGERAVSQARHALEREFGVPIEQVPRRIGLGALGTIATSLAAGASVRDAVSDGVAYAARAGRGGVSAIRRVFVRR